MLSSAGPAPEPILNRPPLATILLVLLITPAARPAAAEDLDDPFPVRGQLLLALPFLEPAPRSAFLLPARAVRWGFHMAYENVLIASDGVLRQDRSGAVSAPDGVMSEPVLEEAASDSPSRNSYYVDGETLRAVINASFALGRKFEVEIELPMLWHTSGFMDSPIDSFHSALGLPDGDRPLFARHQYVVGYRDAGGSVYFGEAPSGLRPGDLVLSARMALARVQSGRSALALSGAFKLPTGSADRLDGSGSADVAAGLLASWRLGRTTLHAGYQYSRLGPSDQVPDGALSDRQSLFGTYGFRASSRTSLLVQILATSGPFPTRKDGSLGDAALELAFGMRHAAGSGISLEWAVLESLSPALNIPDVGFFFGVTCRRNSGGRQGPV